MKIKLSGMLHVIIIFSISIYIFFPGLLIRNICMMIAVIGFFLCMLLRKNAKVYFEKSVLAWIVVISVAILFSAISGAIWDFEAINEVKWLIIAGVGCQLVIWVNIDSMLAIKIFTIFGMLFLITTYLQALTPNIVDSINNYILTAEEMYVNKQASLYGAYYGITSSNFLNAFFISIVEATLYAYTQTINQKKKLKYYIFYMVGLSAVFLTGKKSIVLSNMLVLLVCIFFTERRKLVTFLKKFASIFAVGGITLLFINSKTGMLSILLENIMTSSDISNGRIGMFSVAWESIKDNILLGKGLGSTYKLYNQGMHNIYIQLLYEVGIICTSLFILFFAWNIVKGFRLVLQQENSSSKYILHWSIYMQLIFLVYGMSGNPLFYYSSLIIYFFALALQFIEKGKNKNESRDINI